jgi:hypothetical protein
VARGVPTGLRPLSPALHAGAVAPGGPFDPDDIAEHYARLHGEPPGAWTRDVLYSGRTGEIRDGRGAGQEPMSRTTAFSTFARVASSVRSGTAEPPSRFRRAVRTVRPFSKRSSTRGST